jgi:hypothetical protein
MRIAVCLSGQLRQWKLAVENQKWFWRTANKPNVEIDYFAHTWTYSWDRPGVSAPYKSRDISEQEIEEFNDAYSFKGLVVDSKSQIEFRGNDHWSSLFYSYSKSILLKRKYEIENNFKYDVVIKSRPDVLFHPDKTLFIPRLYNNCIYTNSGQPMPGEYNMFNLNDIIFLGNSYTMDLLTNIYFYRQNGIEDYNIHNVKNIHPMGPGTLMHEYFRDYGITPIFENSFSQILLKEGCPQDLDMFKTEEFEIMSKYWQEWYTK